LNNQAGFLFLGGIGMPNPKDYKDEDSFMAACVPAVKGEGKDQDQAVAQCINMWKERDKKPEAKTVNYDEERRFFKIEDLKVERDVKTKTPKIVGYAAVFNSMSENLGNFREQIAPGAFKNAIKVSDVRALFNHDPNYVLGRTTSGTLKLKEDSRGLWMELTPPDSQIIKDLVITPIERGDITQQSFGFTVKSDKWDDVENDIPTRTLLEINELFDVAPVTYPAYKDTNVSIALRSLQQAKEKKDEPKFEIVDEPIEEKKTEIQEILSMLEKIDSTKLTLNELIQKNQEVSEKIKSYLEKNSITSESEPLQGKEDNKENEGAADPLKGEEQVRDVFKEIDNKFEKYGERFFK